MLFYLYQFSIMTVHEKPSNSIKQLKSSFLTVLNPICNKQWPEQVLLFHRLSLKRKNGSHNSSLTKKTTHFFVQITNVFIFMGDWNIYSDMFFSRRVYNIITIQIKAAEDKRWPGNIWANYLFYNITGNIYPCPFTSVPAILSKIKLFSESTPYIFQTLCRIVVSMSIFSKYKSQYYTAQGINCTGCPNKLTIGEYHNFWKTSQI